MRGGVVIVKMGGAENAIVYGDEAAPLLQHAYDPSTDSLVIFSPSNPEDAARVCIGIEVPHG